MNFVRILRIWSYPLTHLRRRGTKDQKANLGLESCLVEQWAVLGAGWGDASPAASMRWLRLGERLTRSMCGDTAISSRGGRCLISTQQKLILYLPHAQVWCCAQHLQKHHHGESSQPRWDLAVISPIFIHVETKSVKK